MNIQESRINNVNEENNV